MRSDNPETNPPDKPHDQIKNTRLEEREYHEILDVLPDIIYKISPEGYFVFLSKSVTVLGYTEDELIGKHFSAIVHPEDLPYVSREAILPRLHGRATGGDKAPKLFDERRCGTRSTKNMVVRLLPKKTAATHKQADDLRIVHGEVSASGHYNSISDSSASGEFQGSVGTIRHVKKPPKIEAAFYGEIATFGKYDVDSANPHKEFLGTVGVIRDVSERKRLEKENAELEQELFHAKKMQAIGELAGGIAHDFNNLLGVISGHTEIISRKFSAVDPQLAKYTERILSAIVQAADLTGKLLAFAHKGKYINAPLDMHELLIDTIQLLQHSINRNIEIRHELGAERAWIMGDQNQIKNALINIAINARDAMPQGGELVFSSENETLRNGDGSMKRRDGIEGDYILVSIRDTGIGMDEQVKERLFEPFFTTKGIGKGTGLGLACVHGIVAGHSGLIAVESRKGSGTTFKIYLPTVSDIPLRESAASEGAPLLTRSPGHIMLVDDEKMFLDVTTEMLMDNGYIVTPFQDGRQATAYYREHTHEIDLVIIDMIMPFMSGKECFNALKEINDNVHAIISTGYSLEKDAEILTQKGIVGFLQKPFDSDKLFTFIERALQMPLEETVRD
ncbi:MAG: response regulator [Smithellaceae bacterium]|nr:response regulator [Smithellaceae bacterium]